MSNKLIGVIEDDNFDVQVQITERGLPGKDGYTPIKGIDYFDGEKGIQGEQGEQGIQGPKGDPGEVTLAELDVVQQELTQHKLDYVDHLTATMPHQFKDLKNDKTYNFGFQLSGEGKPQIIYEEVI